jgi:hypothetical protein
LRLKLKAAIKEEPELQESMPTLTNTLESHTKKMDTTTTKLTLEIFCDCGIIAVVTIFCLAANNFANLFANYNSDHYPQCRGEVFEKARTGEVRSAEKVISDIAKCK